ncbi:MAG: hypothetical protein AAF363_06940 [Bacteroidota bacterium]
MVRSDEFDYDGLPHLEKQRDMMLEIIALNNAVRVITNSKTILYANR